MSDEDMIAFLRDQAVRDAAIANMVMYPPDPPVKPEDTQYWEAAERIESLQAELAEVKTLHEHALVAFKVKENELAEAHSQINELSIQVANMKRSRR